MTIIRVEGADGNPEWLVSMPFAVDIARLPDIADDIESGEIMPGAFVLNIKAEDYDALPPDLVRRLGAFVVRSPPDGPTRHSVRLRG